MNEWQIAQQIVYLIRQRKWGGDSNAQKVFSPEAVRITENGEIAISRARRPLAALQIGSGEADQYNPGLEKRTLLIRLSTAVPGDPHGEGSLMGRNRTGGATQSQNRGLIEVQRELLATIGALYGTSGIMISANASTSAQPDKHEGALAAGIGLMREYAWDVWCTVEPFYHPCTVFVATAAGGGAVSLSWTLPPDRFDRLRVKLRRAAGSTPPATHDAGTAVSLSSDLATSKTDSPGAGTFSYALFAMYDDFCETTPGSYSRSTERNASAARSKAGLVVT